MPDHTIKDITGASFAGFYYICFQKSTSTIEGFYYHRSSEWYNFNLKTDNDYLIFYFEKKKVSKSKSQSHQRKQYKCL